MAYSEKVVFWRKYAKIGDGQGGGKMTSTNQIALLPPAGLQLLLDSHKACKESICHLIYFMHFHCYSNWLLNSYWPFFNFNTCLNKAGLVLRLNCQVTLYLIVSKNVCTFGHPIGNTKLTKVE